MRSRVWHSIAERSVKAISISGRSRTRLRYARAFSYYRKCSNCVPVRTLFSLIAAAPACSIHRGSMPLFQHTGRTPEAAMLTRLRVCTCVCMSGWAQFLVSTRDFAARGCPAIHVRATAELARALAASQPPDIQNSDSHRAVLAQRKRSDARRRQT